MTRGEAWVALASVVAGVCCWNALAGAVGPLLLPTPAAVLGAIVDERGRLAVALGQTAIAAGAGLGVAFAAGVGGAILAWLSGAARVALLPWTTLVQVVPIVAIAPLLVVWLGYGPPVAATTAAVAAFYPVYSAAGTGLRAPGPELEDLLRLYGASRLRALVDLHLPAALPALFSGLRSAAGLAVIGAIVGEFVGSNGVPPALGQVVMAAARSARLDLCFAAVVAAAALALAFHLVLLLLERRWVAPWYGSPRDP